MTNDLINCSSHISTKIRVKVDFLVYELRHEQKKLIIIKAYNYLFNVIVIITREKNSESTIITSKYNVSCFII